MKNILKNALREAESHIIDSSDTQLFSDKFESIVFERHKIQAPYLDTAKTEVSIEEEIISFHNAPANVTFTPGEPMQFARYKIPIVGSADLFVQIIGEYYFDRYKTINSRGFSIMFHSQQPISGNQSVIEELNGKAKNAIEGIQSELFNFKNSAEIFNENELRPFITQKIKRERDSRDMLSSSIKGLNPFS